MLYVELLKERLLYYVFHLYDIKFKNFNKMLWYLQKQ